jgi:diaminohydroxyphosphoribosylaminopyrimidine deaminase / 5-amino-6-(5-phosphoribosylamino)uracil reductase
MRRALELARRGRGFTHPNPLVGAVIVGAEGVVGEGYHRQYGGPHAEIEALRAAGEAARGATMYVTLEPCAHHGRTPPCTEAVSRAGIARVVYAASDPNQVAGGGADRLRQAGVEVVEGVEQQSARELNAAFFRIHERGAPFVALKLAISLDGRIAAAPGERTQLTGSAAQTEAHRLRADHEAVLVGSRTALIDDPLLTVRLVPRRSAPVRVVVSSAAALPISSRLVATVAEAPVWVLCAEDAPAEAVERLRGAGVTVLLQPRADRGGVDLSAARRSLAEAGVRSVLVEGGAALAASLLDEGLVDRLHLFLSPRVVGATGVLGLESRLPGDWRYTEVQRLDPDILLTLDPAMAPGEPT